MSEVSHAYSSLTSDEEISLKTAKLESQSLNNCYMLSANIPTNLELGMK
jgi:hypothetical protein